MSAPPSSSQGACPSDNRIAAFLSGDAVVLEQVEAHIAECSACREVVALRAGPSSDSLSEEPRRYVVRGELARGGMGRILDAWDRRHGRAVAIKVLLHRTPALAARFERETALTARLQHPSIVALYDSGTLPGGEPFFVMKRVHGTSLATAIGDARSEAERHALLHAVLAATEALAYAHEQGVVHRDLKPANVLVGMHGETVVIDWGLAKQLRGDEEDVAADGHGHGRETEGDEPASVPADLTAHGQALGTPCYMPPEQARGEPVDERADVYALGAMLYHVLAGEPPFAGSSSRGVVDALLSGPPAPLDARAPHCPPDLAAIVAKAMARDPADRYASARDMALDLRRHSLGQLVSAHQYSVAALLGRWARRHRTLLSMAALLAASVAATAGVGVHRVVKERDRADRARVLAEERGHSALVHREAAEALVDYALVDLRKQLAPLGRLDLLTGVGTEVEKYYASLPADEEDSRTTATLRHRALTQDVLGEVAETQHEPAAVRAREQAAVALLDEALERDPADASTRARRVEAELRLATALQSQGLSTEAIATGRQAADEAARLAASAPSNEEAQLLAVRAARELSNALFDQGDERESLASARTVMEMLAARARARPTDADIALDLADSQVGLGQELGFFGRDQEMVDSERSAQTVLAALDQADSRVIDLTAQALQLESGALVSLGRSTDALDAARRSVALREQLVAHDPANVDWQKSLSFALANVSTSLEDLGRLGEATAASRREVAVIQSVVDRAPDDVTLRGLLAQTAGLGLAPLLAEAGQTDEALRCLSQAQTTLEPLAQPEGLRWRWVLASVLSTETKVQLQRGRIEEALASADRADALARGLTPRTDDEVLILQARTRGQLGQAQLARGDVAAARESLQTARADFDEFWSRNHDRAEWMRGAPETLGALASLLARTGSRDDARACLDSAITALEQLEAGGRLSATARGELARLRVQRRGVGP